MKVFLSKNGFSLIELMVVVVIVGILASIVSSGYQGLLGRARQAEAKAALGGMFTSEKLFHQEFQSYTMCIKQTGFGITDSKRYYVIGIAADDPLNCGPSGTASCLAYSWNPTSPPCDSSCAIPIAGTDTNFPATVKVSSAALVIDDCDKQRAAGLPVAGPLGWTASRDSFILGAAGNISDAPIYDMWSIDHRGIILNVQSGL